MGECSVGSRAASTSGDGDCYRLPAGIATCQNSTGQDPHRSAVVNRPQALRNCTARHSRHQSRRWVPPCSIIKDRTTKNCSTVGTSTTWAKAMDRKTNHRISLRTDLQRDSPRPSKNQRTISACLETWLGCSGPEERYLGGIGAICCWLGEWSDGRPICERTVIRAGDTRVPLT